MAVAAEHGSDARPPAFQVRTHLELGALTSAVPCARLHVRQVLWEWGLSALTDHVALIVSELVTNAVEASADGVARFVRLTLCADAHYVSVGVWDDSPAMPEPEPHALDSDSGRGFEIVTMLAASISVIPDQDRSGKTIWAHLRHE